MAARRQCTNIFQRPQDPGSGRRDRGSGRADWHRWKYILATIPLPGLLSNVNVPLMPLAMMQKHTLGTTQTWAPCPSLVEKNVEATLALSSSIPMTVPKSRPKHPAADPGPLPRHETGSSETPAFHLRHASSVTTTVARSPRSFRFDCHHSRKRGSNWRPKK